MGYKTIIVLIFGLVLLIDYFKNKKRKQIEVYAFSNELFILVILLVFFKNTIATLILGICLYIIKYFVVGSFILCGKIEKEVIKKAITRQNIEYKIYISKIGNIIFIRSGFNILEGYRLRFILSKELSEYDQRKNNTEIYLILAVLCIILFMNNIGA